MRINAKMCVMLLVSGAFLMFSTEIKAFDFGMTSNDWENAGYTSGSTGPSTGGSSFSSVGGESSGPSYSGTTSGPSGQFSGDLPSSSGNSGNSNFTDLGPTMSSPDISGMISNFVDNMPNSITGDPGVGSGISLSPNPGFDPSSGLSGFSDIGSSPSVSGPSISGSASVPSASGPASNLLGVTEGVFADGNGNTFLGGARTDGSAFIDFGKSGNGTPTYGNNGLGVYSKDGNQHTIYNGMGDFWTGQPTLDGGADSLGLVSSINFGPDSFCSRDSFGTGRGSAIGAASGYPSGGFTFLGFTGNSFGVPSAGSTKSGTGSAAAGTGNGNGTGLVGVSAKPVSDGNGNVYMAGSRSDGSSFTDWGFSGSGAPTYGNPVGTYTSSSGKQFTMNNGMGDLWTGQPILDGGASSLGLTSSINFGQDPFCGFTWTTLDSNGNVVPGGVGPFAISDIPTVGSNMQQKISDRIWAEILAGNY